MNEYKLQDLIHIYNGRPHAHLEVGNIPVYGSGGIMCYVNDSLYDGEVILLPRKGTLSNIMYSNQKIWAVDTMYYATVNDKADPYYLYKYLTLLNLSHLDSGSALPSMTQSVYYDIKVSLPNINTQQNIANVLKILDSKIELNNKINTELEAMAKTLYGYWFVQFDFPDVNGKPYRSCGGKMVYNEKLKYEIPEGWGINELKEITSLIRRGVSPKYVESEGFPVLNQKCIRDQRVLFEFSRRCENNLLCEDERWIKVNDILVNSTGVGTLGRVAFVKWKEENKTVTDSHITVVRGNQEINSHYLAYTMLNLQGEIERAAEGSTGQVELRKEFLENLLITVPSKWTQQKFSDFVLPIIEQMAKREQENQQLASLRDWLLPMLMNGQVEFKDQLQPQIKTSDKQVESFQKIQSLYFIIYANNELGIQQGEMAIAKDLYLVDRIGGINTGFNFAQHNWGSFDPTEKQIINNKQYFIKKNYPNSKAIYYDLKDDGELLSKISMELKTPIKQTIQTLHQKVFSNFQRTAKAEEKELYATVLKCIEDTQSIELSQIREEMKRWKTPKQQFSDKAAKFSEERTKVALNIIVREGWHKNVMK